jgi:hypothetical protein
MDSGHTSAKSLLASLRKRLPKGAALPDALSTLISAWSAAERGQLGFVNLGEADIAHLVDLKPAPLKRILAFASVSCGDQLCLWWPEVAETPRVVVVGAHGEDPLVFPDLPDFLVHLVEGRTGVPDLDEGEAAADARSQWVDVPRGAAPGPRVDLSRAFQDWLLIHRPKGRAVDPQVMEELREQIVGVVLREAMSPDTLDPWEGPDEYRQWRLEVDPTLATVRWPQLGMVDFPATAELWPAMSRLLLLTGQTTKPVKITVDADGCLFPDARTTVRPLAGLPGTSASGKTGDLPT